MAIRWARALLLLLCLLAVPLHAQEPQSAGAVQTEGSAGAWEPWQLAMVKTVTYRIFASIDVIVGGYLMTGSELETAAIVAVVAGTKSIIYYGHEMAWSYYGPSEDDLDPDKRSLIKAITYRIASMTNVFILSLLFTDSIEISGGLMLLDALYGMGVYYLHETLWNHFGPPVRAAPAAMPKPGAVTLQQAHP